MAGRLEVFGRVFVFRGIAAAHVSAGQAEPQVNPRVPQFHTLFANVLIGCGEPDLICVLAIHLEPSFLPVALAIFKFGPAL
jgi:hypothetical protein